MDNISNVLLNMLYRRLQKNCGLDIFYKVDNGIYKFILLIDNHGRKRIKTKENLNMVKEKICYLPEFIQGHEYKFLTILLHGSKKDQLILNGEKNLISLSMDGRNKYINCEKCFKEELQKIMLCRKEEKLNRKKIALNDTTSNRRQKLPILTILLIAACIAVFILPIEANDYGISGTSILEKRYITLFSYIFLHGGIVHLMNNCIAMCVIGSKLERRIRSLNYGVLIIVSAVYGGMATVCMKIIMQEAYIPTVGMSGVVYAACGALLIRQIQNKEKYTGMLLYTIISLLIGFIDPYTDNTVHIAGLVTGCVFMGFIALCQTIHKNFISIKVANMALLRKNQ